MNSRPKLCLREEADGSGLANLNIMRSCLETQADEVSGQGVTWLSHQQDCHVTDLKRRQSMAGGERAPVCAALLECELAAANGGLTTCGQHGMWLFAIRYRMAVVSWLEWVGLMCLVEPPSAVDVEGTSQVANQHALCEASQGSSSDALGLRFGLPTCASLEPPAKSLRVPVSSLCCPRNLLLLLSDSVYYP